jgi:hypothetical protein
VSRDGKKRLRADMAATLRATTGEPEPDLAHLSDEEQLIALLKAAPDGLTSRQVDALLPAAQSVGTPRSAPQANHSGSPRPPSYGRTGPDADSDRSCTDLVRDGNVSGGVSASVRCVD